MSIYRVTLDAKKNVFTSSFSIWMPFVSFFCLIAPARTPSWVPSGSGENGCPHPVPGAGEKPWALAPSTRLAVGLS